MYQRVLIKVSGEALSSEQSVICRETVLKTAGMLKTIWQKGVQIGDVVGGGNIMRGRSAEGMERNRADHMGMLPPQSTLLPAGRAGTSDVPCSVQSAVRWSASAIRSLPAGKKRAGRGKVVTLPAAADALFSLRIRLLPRAAEIGADALLLAKKWRRIFGGSEDGSQSGEV